MVLSGKCKEEFFVFLKKYAVDHEYLLHNDYESIYAFFQWQSELHQNALIIEYFDSVGIYINILNKDLQRWFYYEIKALERIKGVGLVKTRQEATTEAIKKANEIRNEQLND